MSEQVRCWCRVGLSWLLNFTCSFLLSSSSSSVYFFYWAALQESTHKSQDESAPTPPSQIQPLLSAPPALHPPLPPHGCYLRSFHAWSVTCSSASSSPGRNPEFNNKWMKSFVWWLLMVLQHQDALNWSDMWTKLTFVLLEPAVLSCETM